MNRAISLLQTSSEALNRCYTPSEFYQSLYSLSTSIHTPIVVSLNNNLWILQQETEAAQALPLADTQKTPIAWRKWLLRQALPVARLSDYMPIQELIASPLYRHWLEPDGWLYGAVVTASHERQLLAWSLFLRSQAEGDFSSEFMEHLAQWQPSFATAARRVLQVQGRLGRAALIGAIADQYHLSKREREVLHAVIEGNSDEQIAQKLYIASGTVKNHIEHIREKTSTHHRIDLTLLVLKKLPE
ncbi:MAG: hypothetical protein IT210_13465 [Armatimonadetes bacterium]|nr:hypothetical protein [Armatimonadota bacterium]